MQDKLEQIFPGQMTLGKHYQNISMNLWKNGYLFNLRLYFNSEGISNFQTNLNSANLAEIDENQWFQEADQRMKFYKQAKVGRVIDSTNIEASVNQDYFERCQRLMEVPLPTFVKLN
jgi:hypothetical protein